jgi:AraC-like DNA-binding protein
MRTEVRSGVANRAITKRDLCFDKAMYFRLRPGPPIAPYVEALWSCEGYEATHRKERVVPNGRFQLVIDLMPRGRAIVIGMRTTCSILETASIQSVVGVMFRPGGARPFFGPPADEFLNRAVSLEQVWGFGSDTLRERLLEATDQEVRLRILQAELHRRLQHVTKLHSAVRHALEEFGSDPHLTRVLKVARDSGLSRRRLSGLFREQVGLTPKLYCRLCRFQEVVRRIASGGPIDWAQLSLDGGYCDQAHMVHEFHEFSGVPPGAWLASERPFRNHSVID